jgi:DNA-binding beta-propeller fold protein YncE
MAMNPGLASAVACVFLGALLAAGPECRAQSPGEAGADPEAGEGRGAGAAERPAWSVFAAGPDHAAASVAVLDPDALAAAREHRGRLTIERFPLGLGRSVDLVVEPFRVVSPDARFVVGRMDGPDEAMDFDPQSIVFWRGRVAGFPGSHVFISIAETSTFGRIELGAGRPTYVVSSRGGDPAAGGIDLAPGQVAVFRGRGGPGHWTVPTLCGTDTAGFDAVGVDVVGAGPENPPMMRGLRMAELAVDSDYAFYRLFDDEQAAATYLVQVYAVVSDIFVRDVLVRLDLVFLRVWTTASHPYQGGASYPLIPSGVRYQVAQLMSGRKDAGAGGVANGICSTLSWVAYALGFFTDPTTPNVFNQDMRIAAHEIGHNLGAPHTHDIGIDRCHDPNSPPRRGTIMSYCTQTFSGGSALTDMRLHTGIQQRIFNCIPRRLVFDCNQNLLDDADDIASGRSPDVNANNIPDECEDCNNNGIIDEYDIASGFSLDVNENGIPDECEPDCNNNQIPDEMDIRMGWSLDENGNGIPDECEADCNGNGIPDFAEILADMSLDLDRDGVLDQCQDCDGSGVPDIVALDHANNVWAVSSGDGLLKEYHQQTGVYRASVGQGELSDPVDVLITPDKRVLVTSAGDARVVEFDHRGGYVRDLVAAGSGGLEYPSALALGPDRSLLVADRDTNSVLQYHLDTGDPMGHFVEPGAGGLAAPYGLAFGPKENLYVSTNDSRVLEFDGASGAFVREFVEQGAGGLIRPRGILFIPGPTPGADPRFIVAGLGNNAALEFDAGSGEFVGQFNNGDYRGKLRGPWALRLGPDGNVYVSSSRLTETPDPPALHLTDPHIFIFDGRNGNLIRAYVQGRDSLLANPKGFDFVPGHDRDCNLNHIPDWCDIASGRSLDRNNNGIPDECEDLCYADCDGDGVLDFLDFLCFQNAFLAADPYADCDGNGRLDFFDFLCFQNAFLAGCP